MDICLLKKQFADLKLLHPRLRCKEEKDKITFSGKIEFNREWNDIPLAGNYEIKIQVTTSFPSEIPQVWETSNMVPDNYSHYQKGLPLCLGISTELAIKLQRNPTITFFVETFVADYFYSLNFWIKYGSVPYGERSHNQEGVYEFYKEYFFVNTKEKVCSLLKAIVKSENIDIQKSSCPCGSNLPVYLCWHSTLFSQSFSRFEMDHFQLDCKNLACE